MDTSETYIKMCDCEEVQQGHTFIHGDCWSDDGISVLIVLPRHFPIANCIWLPRQEDLQEIVGKDDMSLLVYRFFGYVSGLQEHGYSWGTMEQLWLRFVMVDKHSKVWDGKEWVKGK